MCAKFTSNLAAAFKLYYNLALYNNNSTYLSRKTSHSTLIKDFFKYAIELITKTLLYLFCLQNMCNFGKRAQMKKYGSVIRWYNLAVRRNEGMR